MDAKQLASLFNSMRGGSLPDGDQRELSHMLEDFLTSNHVDLHDDELDDDESIEDSDRCDSDMNHESSDDDEPLVRVEDEVIANEPAEMDVCAAENDGYMFAQARVRCCKANGAGCKRIKVPDPGSNDARRGCITQFTPEEIVSLQLSVQDMDRDAREWLILGILSSYMRNGPKTENSRHSIQTDRKKNTRSSYNLLNRAVSKDAFLFLLGISQDMLTRLHKHYQAEGLTPTTRRAGGRKNNTRSLSLQDTDHVIRFIKHDAEDHAVRLPGRVPGFRKENILLLPSSATKSRVFRLYADHANQYGYRLVGKSTFRNLWGELCPYIVVARPMTDLCWRCQQNNTNIYHSANLTMEGKKCTFVAAAGSPQSCGRRAENVQSHDR